MGAASWQKSPRAGKSVLALRPSPTHNQSEMLKLAEIVAASRDVAATRSRKQKTARLAELLARLEPSEVRAGVGFLCGELRQGKLGVGYRTLQGLRQLPRA